MFSRTRTVTAPPAKVSVMPENIPLERRVARVKRIRASLDNAVGDKKIALQRELDKHLEALLEHKKALEDMLGE